MQDGRLLINFKNFPSSTEQGMGNRTTTILWEGLPCVCFLLSILNLYFSIWCSNIDLIWLAINYQSLANEHKRSLQTRIVWRLCPKLVLIIRKYCRSIFDHDIHDIVVDLCPNKPFDNSVNNSFNFLCKACKMIDVSYSENRKG